MTWKEYKQWFFKSYEHQQYDRIGCGGPVIVACLVMVFLLCGCRTVTESQSTVDMHRMALLTERMDSMFHLSQTWQQSIYEKQQSLVDSFKQSEVRDTSHIIFLNEKGDTAKEVITIYKERTIEHTTNSKEVESLQESFRQTDSLLQVSLAKQEKMDSTLQSYQKTTVVEEKAPWYEQWWNSIKMVIIGIVVGVLAAYLFLLFLRRNRKTL